MPTTSVPPQDSSAPDGAQSGGAGGDGDGSGGVGDDSSGGADGDMDGGGSTNPDGDDGGGSSGSETPGSDSGGLGSLPGANGRWVSLDSPFSGGAADVSPVKLPDGSVQLIGGASWSYRFIPSDDTFVLQNPPPDARVNTAAALLADGRVLVAGGRSSSERDGLASCFLYDPDADVWTPTADLPAPRARQAALALPGGDVLVVGGVGPGVGGTPVGDVYRYLAASGQWTTLRPLAQPVRFPTLFLLNPQTVLVMAENSQVYDLGSEAVTISPGLTELRRYASPVQLPNSNVLALGGAPLDVLGDGDKPFATVDEYALGANSWLSRAPLGVPRSEPGAVTLPDGTVFVAGGVGAFVSTDADMAEQSAERYVPIVDTWYAEAPPPTPTGHPAVLLDDGSVFFVSGARFHPEPWQ